MPLTTSWKAGLASSGPYSAIITLSAAGGWWVRGVVVVCACVGEWVCGWGGSAVSRHKHGGCSQARSAAHGTDGGVRRTGGAVDGERLLRALHVELPRVQVLADADGVGLGRPLAGRRRHHKRCKAVGVDRGRQGAQAGRRDAWRGEGGPGSEWAMGGGGGGGSSSGNAAMPADCRAMQVLARCGSDGSAAKIGGRASPSSLLIRMRGFIVTAS